MTKPLSILFALIIYPLFLSAGGNETDTLKLINQLPTADPAQKVTLMLQISWAQRNSNTSRSYYWAEQALHAAQKQSISELTAECYFSLGYLEYLSNNFDPALNHLQRALKLYQRVGVKASQAKALNRIGNVYQLKGSYRDALSAYNHSLILGNEIADTVEIARSLTNISSVYRLFGRYTDALGLSLQALDLYEKTKDNEGIAWTALNIARLFRISNEPEKAFEYLDKSLRGYKKLNNGKGDLNGIILCMSEQAAINLMLGKIDLAFQQNLHVYIANVASGNEHGVAMAKGINGIILYKLGRYAKAEQNIVQALEIKQRIGDSLDLAMLYRYLGLVKIKQKRAKEAISYLDKADKIALKQNLKQDLKNIYLGQTLAYSMAGNLDEAIRKYVAFSSLRDSLNRQQVTQMEEKYALEKQMKDKELQQQQLDAEQQSRLERQKIISIAVGAGLILALAFAFLLLKRNEEKRRSNLLLEQQNREILNQKEEIEAQHEITTQQRDKIAGQQKVITDSIRYAGRIQTVMLPDQQALSRVFADHFILYRPKSFVSGDFYWISEQEDYCLFSAADCTGHGVPGAFMSLLGISSLNELVARNQLTDPSAILNLMRDTIVETLHQTGSAHDPLDGIDMALCSYHKKSRMLSFSGAYNSILIARKADGPIPFETANLITEYEGVNLWELKGQKMPIGFHPLMGRPFITATTQILPGDKIYLMSDGYGDQMGGPKGNKFLQNNLKKYIAEIQQLPLAIQNENLDNALQTWMGHYKQVDDILIMGIVLP